MLSWYGTLNMEVMCVLFESFLLLSLRTSLQSSSAINLMVLTACFQSPEKCLFLGLLKWVVLLGFLNLIALTGLCLIWWIIGLNYISGGSHLMISYLQASSSHNYYLNTLDISSNKVWCNYVLIIANYNCVLLLKAY